MVEKVNNEEKTNEEKINQPDILDAPLKLRNLLPIQKAMRQTTHDIKVNASVMEVIYEALKTNNIITEEQMAAAREVVNERYRQMTIVAKHIRAENLSIDEKLAKMKEDGANDDVLDAAKEQMIKIEEINKRRIEIEENNKKKQEAENNQEVKND